MLNWIEKLKHRKALQKIQHEKELKQATCNHTFIYLGEYAKESPNGVGIDIDYYYMIQCTECELEQSFTHKSEALGYCRATKVNSR